MTDDVEITRAAKTLTAARHAIALVGAGISVESGIPPFRGAGGLWTKRGEPPMDGYRRFLDDPGTAWAEMLARRESDDEFVRALDAARPNAAHHALADLERAGVLKHTITQNIDNLHAVAGTVLVTEIHGNRTKVRCLNCNARHPWQDADLSELPPRCRDCGGLLKSDTVMFGEPIPPDALAACHGAASRADCILIAGTSATVYPAAGFAEIVAERGGSLVEVNTEPTPFTPRAAAVLRGPAGQLLPRLAAKVQELLEKTM